MNKTPSPSRESQVLRAHSPWTAMRTRKQRRKGQLMEDARNAVPVRESDDDVDAENRAPAGGRANGSWPAPRPAQEVCTAPYIARWARNAFYEPSPALRAEYLA